MAAAQDALGLGGGEGALSIPLDSEERERRALQLCQRLAIEAPMRWRLQLQNTEAGFPPRSGDVSTTVVGALAVLEAAVQFTASPDLVESPRARLRFPHGGRWVTS